MTNLSGCIVLPPGVVKISRFEKVQIFDKSDTDISNLIIECFDRIKSCQKQRMNNFKFLLNPLGYTDFIQRASEVCKIQSFCRKNCFWSTLAAPREKTVHPRELVILFKDVGNNIVDIIHFDQNAVQSNLKALCAFTK